MARLIVAVALVALLAGSASAQTLNQLTKGPGASLSPSSVVGTYRGPISAGEFADIAANDKSGFLSTYGFTFENSQPSQPGFTYNFQTDGDFFFTGSLTNGTALVLSGAFRVYVCNSAIKGQAQVAGVFNVPGVPGVASFARLLTQTFKNTRNGAYYLAVQFFNSDGTPQTVPFPPTGSLGKFILKQDLAQSQTSALTTPPSNVGTRCGFVSFSA